MTTVSRAIPCAALQRALWRQTETPGSRERFPPPLGRNVSSIETVFPSFVRGMKPRRVWKRTEHSLRGGSLARARARAVRTEVA